MGDIPGGIPGYVRLLWGDDDAARPGPKRSVGAHAIGEIGVRLADEGGLDAVSMRSIGAELGLTPMALYRYVASKRELLLTIADAAYGPPPSTTGGRRGWRLQLRDWARAWHAQLSGHPWVVSIPEGQPLLPNAARWLEHALAALAPTKLTGTQKLSAVALVDGFVRARVATAAADPPDPPGGPRLPAPARSEEFPHVRAALAQAVEEAPDEFEFGLITVLDGIGTLVGRRDREQSSRGQRKGVATATRRASP